MDFKTKKRFLSKIKVTESGCWEWQRGLTQGGYGKFSYTPNYKNKKTYQAHRFSLLLHGIELIEGLVVDHICKNKICVNPDHLRQVTHRQNVIDFSNSPPAKMAKRTHCPSCGKELVPENLVQWAYKKFGWRHCRECTVRKNKELKYKNIERHKIRVRNNRQKNILENRKKEAAYAAKYRKIKKEKKYAINLEKWMSINHHG